ncbi:peptidoglycan-binding domain-containing protein [Rathayibacter soli]|uniref:peptidoglycan-binding domain-containing protein n=1 Tax=Rathayibacter soli TaxID=3144168 RepID=UPI0027E534C4|nr:peptidoglycan-binding protein [Glaciibacter superstes]
MSNPGQPTIQQGASGDAVRRLQRGLRRTPNLSIVVDGIFGPATHTAVIEFQQGNPPLVVDGIVGPLTWAALPAGGPMPALQVGSNGAVVSRLQTVLNEGEPQWGGPILVVDGDFGAHTKSAVETFQGWGQVTVDGIVGEHTWDVSLHAASATLESAVGLSYVLP